MGEARNSPLGSFCKNEGACEHYSAYTILSCVKTRQEQERNARIRSRGRYAARSRAAAQAARRLHRRQCPLRSGKARSDLEQGARGGVLQSQRSHLQGTRPLAQALGVLRKERAVEPLDAVRPRRRRLRRHGRDLVPSPHPAPLDRQGAAAGAHPLRRRGIHHALDHGVP